MDLVSSLCLILSSLPIDQGEVFIFCLDLTFSILNSTFKFPLIQCIVLKSNLKFAEIHLKLNNNTDFKAWKPYEYMYLHTYTCMYL